MPQWPRRRRNRRPRCSTICRLRTVKRREWAICKSSKKTFNSPRGFAIRVRMATAPRPRPLDVAHIAGRILNAQRSEYQVNLQQELARAKRVLGDIHPADTLETE